LANLIQTSLKQVHVAENDISGGKGNVPYLLYKHKGPVLDAEQSYCMC